MKAESQTQQSSTEILSIQDETIIKEKGNHIITTAIEHHAILHTGEFLEKHGYEMTYLPILPDGFDLNFAGLAPDF